MKNYILYNIWQMYTFKIQNSVFIFLLYLQSVCDSLNVETGGRKVG